ncbi:MAG: primosomal protein N', partial [Rikenellaceae bacterium]
NITFALPPLTEHQQQALTTITEGLRERSCALLHGVTGSGKTEVYIHLIASELAAERDVLLLLPEIALTTQLIERMERIFGSRVTPYHSGLTPKRRTEIFLSLCQGEQSGQGGRFIVGARSAIFLPLNHLGLIIVDEEHDSSYKQNDPSPRYNARDLAHIVAAQSSAKVVLGSATPSLESWTNAMSGKFAMARLNRRYGGAELPKIVISDTRRAAKRGERRGHLNLDLYRKIEERLERGEQIMLFQNRRGFAPYIECRECGWVARCPNCNISLTMHKSNRELTCHYCNYSEPLPSRCPACKVGELTPMGFGTEKIEEQIGELFPTARVLRLDRDTSTSMRKFEQIIGSFARHEGDILIGTQMITKGFDFPDVTLVGILNADNTLQIPDFRAEERAYSLLTQVAGRAGRREGAEAEVVIQTTQPTHRVLQYVVQADYEGLATTLLEEREAFSYPPYARLLTITLKHKCNNRLARASWRLSQLLRERFGRRVRGPITPPVDRVMGEWILGFTIRIEAGASSMRAREVMRSIVEQWRAGGNEQEGIESRSIKLTFDVDPQ